MNADPQIKRGRKFDQVVEGARAVFMREGFEGASVDEIARDAGVSKATLYSYFPDKQHLFMVVLQKECAAQSEVGILFDSSDMSVEQKLVAICRKLMTFLISDFSQDMFRVCVAEAKRFPELGEAFYESGPRQWCAKIAEFLDSPKSREVLDVPDPLLAADQLAQLCRTDLMLRVVFGIQKSAPEEEINHLVDEAVATFLARYRRV